MSSNPKDPIIRCQVQSVDFGLYTDDDVRTRSVVQITSRQAFDPLHNPLPNGLYDPRLGTTSHGSPCPTCALLKDSCPGHYGHIDLCVPVYHPLWFPDLLKVLQAKCLSCHQLRILPLHRAQLLLLRHNRVVESRELPHRASERNPDTGKATLNQTVLAHAIQDLHNPPSQYPRRDLVALLRSSLHKSCPHCGATSPKIRHDSYNKVFQAPLSKKVLRQNAQENVRIESALVERDSNDDDDESLHESSAAVLATMEEDDEDDEQLPKTKDQFLHAIEVQAQVRRTYTLDPLLFTSLFGTPEHFFLQAIPVPPSRFRPPMALDSMVVEHAQTQSLSQMIGLDEQIRNALANAEEPYVAWIDLQTTVNCFLDSAKDPSATPSNLVPPGIKQILERKEGLFRKNMMGKRVDYACRSVISPDPYVGTNEIGVPLYFASVLTYPTPVTDLNSKEMRLLVERGPHEYPGARWVELNGRRVDLGKMNRQKREAMAAQLLTHLKRGGKPAIVGRQLRDGDYVLMNRQPTLHKPGIMAHRVRVLHNPTQKTIRMHYANCNTYNADFDGDEMNCHFPQSDVARAEAIYIARTDLQYIVPTDGSPLRGLIQDHVVGGVKMTKRDTFLEKWEYQQLLFAALASLPGLEVIRMDARIELLPPAIVKPRELWTGKQVISTLLLHLAKGSDRDSENLSNFKGLSMERKAKTPESAFGAGQDEHLVLIRDGELLRGVLDKAAFGATDFSLVHATYEAYGPEKAGLLLNALGRLFTAYIQFYVGHSCRMEDLVLTPESDEKRRSLVQRAYNVGSRAAKAWADSEGGKATIQEITSSQPLKPVEEASASARIGELLSGNEGSINFANLDAFMQSKLSPLSSDIVKQCLPSGLAVPFPYNTFGVMTTTGAKGSIVNQSQVTCALGQQALEGRRVPRLSSGRTLPSFAPYDPNPRADGFVMDRFLTGIRPQEYYFHCMAGREGLVDTAVKTSRSGYLQRCLMKHLEELKICYDHTVRGSSGNVVQFVYGEDGLDPTKAAYLDCTEKSFEYMARNLDSLKRHNPPLPYPSIEQAADDACRSETVVTNAPSTMVKGDFVKAMRLRSGEIWTRGMLCRGWHDAVVAKVHSNGRTVDLKYLSDGQTAKKVPMVIDFGPEANRKTPSATTRAVLVKPAAADPILSSARGGHRLGQSGSCVSEKVAGAAAKAANGSRVQKSLSVHGATRSDFESFVSAKYSASLCAPGEAVGSIAAQSIGEPSTQMTLNTFHLAGSGANVTLGIPRLREIIMTASRELKTPTMSVPIADSLSDKEATRLAREFSRLPLMELIAGSEGVCVIEKLEKGDAGEWSRAYYVSITLHPLERIREAFGLSIHDVAAIVGKNFVPALSQLMKKEIKRSSVDGQSIAEVSGGDNTDYSPEKEDAKDSPPVDMDDLGDSDDDEVEDDVGGDEDGADAARHREQRKASVSYDDPEEGEVPDLEDSSDSEEEPESQSSQPMTTDEDGTERFKENELVVEKELARISLQPLRVDPSVSPLLMVDLVEKAASTTVVRAKKSILEAYINDEDGGRGRCLQTLGVNFGEIWRLSNVKHDNLLSNDIWAIACTYGIEAARASIGGQVKSVFGAYGIEVDPRHLSLISDYMTFEGDFKAMNRIGMEENSSALLQMSFETTVHFLRQAAISGNKEPLESPSANIVLGRPIRHGTGSFALLSK